MGLSSRAIHPSLFDAIQALLASSKVSGGEVSGQGVNVEEGQVYRSGVSHAIGTQCLSRSLPGDFRNMLGLSIPFTLGDQKDTAQGTRNGENGGAGL